MRRILLALAMSLSVSSMAISHSGGLDSQGCHAGSRPYHCHRSSSQMVPSTSGGYRLRCDLGSRSRDCIGGGGAGANTLSVQQALIRHCSNLPTGFADGRMGPTTIEAIRDFQRAYGLLPDGVIGPRTAAALQLTPNGRCRYTP